MRGNRGGKKTHCCSGGKVLRGRKRKGWFARERRPPAVQKELSLLLMAGGDSALPEGREGDPT